MRILLVEDKADFAAVVEKAIRDVQGCEVVWRRSKDCALAALAKEPFDVVILDRRIPTQDDFLDDNENHGWAVFLSIKENQPGTSVWFLTGAVDADFPTEILNNHAKNGDIHSCGRSKSIYRVFWKHKISDCIAEVRAFRADIEQMERINLSLAGGPVNMRQEEVRLLKRFACHHRGSSVEVRSLGGGLSTARVLRVSVHNSAGQPILGSVAKVGTFSEIGLERDRYETEIVKLIAGSFPQMSNYMQGASGYAGIFYGVVGSEVKSLFNELVTDPGASASVPARLRAAEAAWIGAREIERVQVATIRRRLIGDVALEKVRRELAGIDLGRIEGIEVSVALCVQHGDLHCANVLFDDLHCPMLIDYPATGRTMASLDPVTLELSTIFHKDAPDRKGWPSEEQARQWVDLDAFVAGASIEAFLRACRQWALDVAGSQEEVWAVAYSYALRQLKYHDTDKVLARGIIRSCIAKFVS